MADDSDLPRDIRQLLARLIRASLLMDEEQRAIERRAALDLHARIKAAATPDRLARLHLDGLWDGAIHDAETPGLHGEPLRVSLQLAAVCPLALGDLVEPGLAIPALEQRIRESAATG